MQHPEDVAMIDQPVRGEERLTHVDALRGFALLGILLVNLLAFSGPSFLYVPPLSWWQGLDRWVEWAVLVAAEGGFYTIFSVLFGWGFGRWMRKRGAAARKRFAQRLGWLLVIGLVHLFGIWVGDILTHYALIGFLLLPFATTSARATALWGAGFYALGIALFATVPADGPTQDAQALVALYGDGGFGAILAARAERGTAVVASVIAYLPIVLGLFLMGASLAKSRTFERVVEERAVRSTLGWATAAGLAIGLPLKAVYGVELLAGDDTQRLLFSTALGGPALGFAYLSAMTLWLTSATRSRWRGRIESALASAGRMALSVYLTQSIVMTLIFYGYGLGLYGVVGPASGVLLALALFTAQVAVARWWLARFRFGPAEWLWRSLTYGQPQPWRGGDAERASAR